MGVRQGISVSLSEGAADNSRCAGPLQCCLFCAPPHPPSTHLAARRTRRARPVWPYSSSAGPAIVSGLYPDQLGWGRPECRLLELADHASPAVTSLLLGAVTNTLLHTGGADQSKQAESSKKARGGATGTELFEPSQGPCLRDEGALRGSRLESTRSLAGSAFNARETVVSSGTSGAMEWVIGGAALAYIQVRSQASGNARDLPLRGLLARLATLAWPISEGSPPPCGHCQGQEALEVQSGRVEDGCADLSSWAFR